MGWQDKLFRTDDAKFNVGDVVKVSVKVKEGDKERIQGYEGTVICKKGSGLNETFTVRKMSSGIGVERIFLLHSPAVDKVKVEKRGEVRRAKLFYLRDKVGKDSRVKEEMKAQIVAEAIPAPVEAAAPAANESK